MEKLKKHFSERGYMYILGALIILIIYFYGKIMDYEENNINEINAVYYMTQLETEDVIGINILGNIGQEISFAKKEDGNWVYVADENLVIEQAGPQYIVELLKEIATEYKVENPEDISIYGINDKCPYIELVTADKNYRIYIGSYNETVKRYYARLNDENNVYGVQINVAEIVEFKLKDYLPME